MAVVRQWTAQAHNDIVLTVLPPYMRCNQHMCLLYSADLTPSQPWHGCKGIHVQTRKSVFNVAKFRPNPGLHVAHRRHAATTTDSKGEATSTKCASQNASQLLSSRITPLAAPPPATLPVASHCRHPAARLNEESPFALLPRLDPSDSANSQQLLLAPNCRRPATRPGWHLAQQLLLANSCRLPPSGCRPNRWSSSAPLRRPAGPPGSRQCGWEPAAVYWLPPSGFAPGSDSGTGSSGR